MPNEISCAPIYECMAQGTVLACYLESHEEGEVDEFAYIGGGKNDIFGFG